MTNTQKVFASKMWIKVQMRLDDNPASNIVMPLNLLRVVAGAMKPTHRVINYRWYLMKKNKAPMVMVCLKKLKGCVKRLMSILLF